MSNLLTALKHMAGKHDQMKHGRGGFVNPLKGAERTVEHGGTASKPKIEISYTKKQPVRGFEGKTQRDREFGKPTIRAAVLGDTVQILSIHAGNIKRSGIGTAMVKDLLRETGATKMSSSGVESKDGKAFLNALSQSGFEVVNR